MRTTFIRGFLSAASLAACIGVCAAQTPQPAAPQTSGSQGSCTMTDADGKTISLPECATRSTTPRPETPASKSAAQKFPFPGEPAPDKNATRPAGVAPEQTSATGDGSQPPSKRFPFPGETPDAPRQAGAAGSGPASGGSGPLKDAGSSGETSPSSSSSSSSSGGMGDLGPDTTDENPYKADDDAARARAAARKSKREAPAPPPKTTADQVEEDLQVADFYASGGNYRGAYLRAKEAVSLAADDPETHFALATSARKLGKLDEAETEFKACLKLDPVPKTKHAAEKALKEMGGGT